LEGGQRRQRRRRRFAAWTSLATCGILIAAFAAPGVWAGSPAQDQYGGALPTPGNRGGSGGNGGSGSGSGPSTGIATQPLIRRLAAMQHGDLLRLPGNVTVRALGSTQLGQGQRERLFRLDVPGSQPRTIAGVKALAQTMIYLAAIAAHGAERVGTASSSHSSWPVAWILLLAVPPVAVAGAAIFLTRRRGGSSRPAHG
jgi:hypothetical protein